MESFFNCVLYSECHLSEIPLYIYMGCYIINQESSLCYSLSLSKIDTVVVKESPTLTPSGIVAIVTVKFSGNSSYWSSLTIAIGKQVLY